MRILVPATLVLSVAALAACTTETPNCCAAPGQAAALAHSTAPAAGNVRRGDTTALMALQYNTPHAGPYAATGASAWVAPSPAPAFVINTPLPPAAPAGPPPAAVANRQPATPAPAAPASELARPEAATPAPAAAPAPNPAVRTAGLALFNANGCGNCHMLADAGAYGEVGPPFDGDTGLTKANAVQTIRNGRGAMPSFGQLSDAEVSALADYLVAYKR